MVTIAKDLNEDVCALSSFHQDCTVTTATDLNEDVCALSSFHQDCTTTTATDLNEDVCLLSSLHQDCMPQLHFQNKIGLLPIIGDETQAIQEAMRPMQTWPILSNSMESF